MKRYKVTTREIWHVTREVYAVDEHDAQVLFLDGEETKREFFSVDPCEEFNTIVEIQNKNEDTRN